SGKDIPDFIFQQPYILDSTFYANPHTAADRYFSDYWARFYGNGNISARLFVSDEARFAGDAIYDRGVAAGFGHYVASNITFANRTVIDEDYKHDPFFAGDLSEADRIFGRVNDAYMNLRFGKFDLFLGRMKRNWGPLNSAGLILSDHPYTYDHLLLSYSTTKIKFSLLFAQLEELSAIDADVTGDSISITQIPDAKKYLVGHRLDFQFSSRLQFAITEMATYGGPDREVDFLFFNPANFYYATQRNDQRAMNGKWALDLFYKPASPLSLYLQFLLDDIVLNTDAPDETEKNDDRFGLMLSVRTGDLLRGLNTDLT
ncbi:MAG: hypothetical protein GWN61_21150, partial [candidate division Zixibacteria bacterium]|nr:capsule assembly Wzi family protein [candidate division KSB1 bacterium]NIT74261.1 capsule assembly Wzi family protein [candidate division KSB1 bacterium]NIV08613.1 hypothetical protein [candidate division Zixibacteria bacterium]NIX58832.1 hypothetical protein [candidate division Zixibacteria bacterium]NIX73941.1 hypothetical protein [candidate division KSB1 bacterium]